MKPAPPNPPKSSIENILNLTEERNRRLAARKAERSKHGRRQFYSHMSFAEWRRKFNAEHLLDIIASLRDEEAADFPFKTGGVCLSNSELRVMISIISWHSSPKGSGLDSAKISRRIKMDKSNLGRILKALGEAGLIINLAGNSAPNLAPNPEIGFWDLRKLKGLRTVRRSSSSRFIAD